MKQITIDERAAGQRLDNYLGRYLKKAPKSFLYRMLRKKNIVLNGKKAAGNELLAAGDEIRLWLSDDTIAGFMQEERPAGERQDAREAYPCTDLDILYEDEHVILINKPAGMLSQKAAPGDVSLCEYLIGYLISSGQISMEDLRTVRPSVCNRLDRNTSGIVCCGKTIAGLSALSGLFRTRNVHKYYLALAMGRITKERRLEGLILKDEKKNVSAVVSAKQGGDGRRACTVVRPLAGYVICGRDVTLLRAQLITGRSHQIRAQLAAEGHTLVGDVKYAVRGDRRFFEEELHVTHQMLHCAKVVFPETDGPLSGISGRTVEAKPGDVFGRLIGGAVYRV